MTVQVTPRFGAEAPRHHLKARDRRYGMSDAYVLLIKQLPELHQRSVSVNSHHLRVYEERGVGLKATDKWAIPLTRIEHDQVHTVGAREEVADFTKGVNAYRLAELLWEAWEVHGDRALPHMQQIIEERVKWPVHSMRLTTKRCCLCTKCRCPITR